MTDKNYLKKLADMQTQIKELVPDTLKENGERKMSDLISRQDAINAVHKDYDAILDFKSDGRTVADSFEDIINALPSAQPEPQWIPVSERLPSESNDYLVTIKFDTETFDTELFYFNAEKTRWLVEERYGENFFVKNKIIAWMELPKPYERKEE